MVTTEVFLTTCGGEEDLSSYKRSYLLSKDFLEYALLALLASCIINGKENAPFSMVYIDTTIRSRVE